MAGPQKQLSPSGVVADMLGRDAWLDQVAEPTIDPTRPIIDPHHHLWKAGQYPYGLAELRRDTVDSHNIVATVFIECIAGYRSDGPEHLRCVGETDYVLGVARDADAAGGPPIAAIVGSANLRDYAHFDEVLDAHEAAGGGRFRGIRHAAAWDASPAVGESHHRPPPGLYRDNLFRRGFMRLAKRDLSFDAWLYHPQIPDLTNLATAFPDTTIILDHFGGPIGLWPYKDRKAVFADWKRNLTALAHCPNVVVKLGGMAMPVNGWGFETATRPPTSAEFVAAQGDWYRAAIDLFGPDRCMFESNFPVDRQSLAYGTYWNAAKKIAARYADREQDVLFRGTAARVYRIDAPARH